MVFFLYLYTEHSDHSRDVVGREWVERHWFASAINWYESKLAILLNVIGAYLADPRFVLHPPA
ncbi:MAG TPA: hypothetical protein V6D37_05275 [Candidatus Sericytochromatia bacterium]